MKPARFPGNPRDNHLGSHDGYRVVRHPHHARLYHIDIEAVRLRAFFTAVKDIDVQNAEYVPYIRFILAKKLAECAGEGFQETVRAITHDRGSGGFTTGVNGTTTTHDDYVRFGTAVGHLLGPANFDAMSGTYYARFIVQHIDKSDSYLRQAYRNLTLHTDGTFVNDATDWLLMMKFEERNAVGGESRLVHLDDWEELSTYSKHPLASHKFTYRSPPSKNVSQTVQRQTFFNVDGKPGICFIDQFVYPETVEQASYLHDMLNSLERSPATKAIPLPVGDLIVLNNIFWMHGRAAFEPNPALYRELMRQRGLFSPS
jgi:glutarate dioxygenase